MEGIRATIEFLLKKSGLVETRGELSKIADAAKKGSREIGLLRDSLNKAGAAMAGAFAAGAVTRFMGQSLAQFAAMERQLNVIGRKFEQFGIGSREAVEGVKNELLEMAKGGGPALAETLPIFNKFIGITKNAAEAMYLTRLAADASETGYIEAGAAADALAAILQGKGKTAAAALGLELNKTNGQVKTNAELMQDAIAMLEGYGDAYDDTQNSLDSFAASWEEFKLSLGEGVAKLIGMIGGLDGITKVFKSIGPAALEGGYKIAEFFIGVGRAAKAGLDLKKLATEGITAYTEAVKTAFASSAGAFGPEIEAAREELDRIWSGVGASSGLSMEEGRRAAIEQARRKTLAEEDAYAARAAEKAKERALKIAAAERDATLALEEERAAALEAGSYERLQKELEVSNLRMRKELETTEVTEAGKAAIRERYRIAEQELINAFIENDLAKQEEALARRAEIDQEALRRFWDLQLKLTDDLAIQRELELAALDQDYAVRYVKAVQANANLNLLLLTWSAERLAITKKYAKAEEEIEKAKQQAKVQGYIMGAQMAIGALRTIFGDNKAFAIAEALINTYQAITQALASIPPPYSYVVAALVAAAGFKQVMKIRSTNPGSGGSAGGGKKGFDDPVNDRAARLGGRRWAADFIRETARGLEEGMRTDNPLAAAAASSSNTTFDYSGRMEVHFHGPVVGGRQGLEELERRLAGVRRGAERNRTVR